MTQTHLSPDAAPSHEASPIRENRTRMTISQIKQIYAPSMQIGTIRNRLRDGDVPLDYSSATYNLSDRTYKQIISILSTSPKPRPDSIESQH